MPAFDDTIHGLGKGGSMPNRGRRLKAEQSSGQRRRVTPLRPPSPVGSLSHDRLKRKRSRDRLVDDNAFKKKRHDGHFRPAHDADDLTDNKSLINLSRSPLARNGSGIIQDTTSVDLTRDSSVDSDGSKGRVNSSTVNSLDQPAGEAGRAPRFGQQLIPSTPSPCAKRKHEVVDLTQSDDDSDNGSAAPPSTPVRKSAQSGSVEKAFGLVTPKTPVTPSTLGRIIAQPHRLEPKDGQVRPANLSPGMGAASLTPTHVRMLPTFTTAPQPDGLTAGSSGAVKDLEGFSKPSPSQDTTKELNFAKAWMPPVLEREADQGQLRRGFHSAPFVVRDRDIVVRKTHGETKNGEEKRAAVGRLEADNASEVESNADPEQTESLSQAGLSKKSQTPLESAAVAASQPQEPSNPTVTSQPQEQGEPAGEGRSDGGSRSLRLDIDREQDREAVQPPRTPSEKKKGFIGLVVLRAPPRELLRIAKRGVQRPDVPIGNQCFLLRLPVEMHNNIFKYLLLAGDPIQVLHQWSKLYRNKVSGLHPEVLQTCKMMGTRGTAFLYGDNTFLYLVRDKYKAGRPQSVEADIDVEKSIPLFRKLELHIERSRTENAYYTTLANALTLLIEHGADLKTLTIAVSPSVEGDMLSAVGYFYRNGEIIEALKALKTKRLVMQVFTPKIGDEPPASLRRVYDLDPEQAQFAKKRIGAPHEALDDLCSTMTRACEHPSEVVAEGLFEKFEVVRRQDERGARSSTTTYALFDDDDDDDDMESEDSDDDGSEFEG